MNDFQTKIQDAFQQAQVKAAARAREFEQEARKVSDRAQAEVKTLLVHAQTGSREQMGILGIELEKLGKKLQELAATPAGNKPPEAAHAADEKATQAPPGSVQ